MIGGPGKNKKQPEWRLAVRRRPLFPVVNLTEQEQARLIALAERFLQQKRLVALQGFELDPLKSARIALLFCLPVLEMGIEWLTGFMKFSSTLPHLS